MSTPFSLVDIRTIPRSRTNPQFNIDVLPESLDPAGIKETCAIMCAEAVSGRCHRRIVTDHVLAHGVAVVHLFSREKGEPASLTPFARVGAGFDVSYPAS